MPSDNQFAFRGEIELTGIGLVEINGDTPYNPEERTVLGDETTAATIEEQTQVGTEPVELPALVDMPQAGVGGHEGALILAADGSLEEGEVEAYRLIFDQYKLDQTLQEVLQEYSRIGKLMRGLPTRSSDQNYNDKVISEGVRALSNLEAKEDQLRVVLTDEGFQYNAICRPPCTRPWEVIRRSAAA